MRREEEQRGNRNTDCRKGQQNSIVRWLVHAPRAGPVTVGRGPGSCRGRLPLALGQGLGLDRRPLYRGKGHGIHTKGHKGWGRG